MATSSSVTFGGSEASRLTKSQDLTRSWTSENFTVESALMKLMDGHWVIRGNHQQLGKQHLQFWKGRFIPESPGCDSSMTGFLIAEGQTMRLSLPPPEKGQMLRSRLHSPQSVAA